MQKSKRKLWLVVVIIGLSISIMSINFFGYGLIKTKPYDLIAFLVGLGIMWFGAIKANEKVENNASKN